ncbi:hypothetical protein JAAARDRAFT_567941 [Jaapia argillacea MUCL 33604]|uniref:Alpha N-terminal protein methyltransferase 1 n=1 Tax=Jaapia argillacea MUCL 33604 TaxID=933084 RepID=A0A067QEE1_9AGAM|nr:hypothetical protein JAAARDRAFT_567941 [Jaapia argillacea MUCL 33604]
MATDLVDKRPDVNAGIEYWSTQPANYDGVLGGFGSGSLPRVDALGSRQFMLYLRPDLSTVPSAVRALHPAPVTGRTRALDVGAGVGRVTSDVLLHLFSDVVLVEPVEPFVTEAFNRGQASASGPDIKRRWKGIQEKTKSVTFIQSTLQSFDPSAPQQSTKVLGRVGYSTASATEDLETGFDVIWCQWCLGHLSDPDLVDFFKRARKGLRDPSRSPIIVKENVCSDTQDGGPRASFDEEDSSLTRSDQAWKVLFRDAGLTIIQEQVQRGFPEGLYTVKMYALR